MRIGIDVGGTHTRGLALSKTGAVLAKAGRATESGSDRVLEAVLQVVSELIRDADSGEIEIGIGIPGLVDSEAGVVHHAANIGIDHMALADLVADATGARVVVDNDVNAATLSAMQHAYPEPRTAPRSFAYINIGTGLGVGLVIDGRLLHGRSGFAGELGHFPLGLTDRQCGCGQRGCIETSTSGSALERFAPTLPHEMHLPEDFLTGLVALLRMTTLAMDPSAIVLGGGVVLNRSGFLDQVLQALAHHEAEVSFISHLAIAERISIAPTAHLGALGAALLPGPIGVPREALVG